MNFCTIRCARLVWQVLFLFTLPAFLAAQTPSKFPEDDPEDFVKKLGEFMTANKRPDMEEAFKVFEKTYKGGSIPLDEMARVMKMANLMAGKLNLSSHPYFKNYVNSVSAAQNDPDSTMFVQWHTMLEKAMDKQERGKTKPTNALLEFSADFLEHRALKTGESGSVTWKVQRGKFFFELNEDVPSIRLEKTNLVGVRKQDSIVVVGTSGAFFPYDQVWKGAGGRVGWQRLGLDSTVYAELGEYRVEATKPLFVCEKARLSYPLYFPGKTLEGKFEENVTPDKTVAQQYPRFESADKKLTINKIGEGIQYVGGFKLQGTSVFGYGSGRERAQVTVFNKKRQRVMVGLGNLFVIHHEKDIVAEGVETTLYMDADSLYHPSVGVRVDIPQQQIHLTRGTKGSDRNPFYSSHYNMNLNVEKVSWYLDRDSLDIGSRVGLIKGVEQKVAFESNQHFDEREYIQLQSTASKNPISTLMVLDKQSGETGIVSDNAFAQELNPKFDYSSIQSLLAEMVAKGFINYYFDRHEIELREKLRHYALASQGKKDFDYLNIESVSQSANAQLNLKSKETTIHEVDKISFSAKQRVGFAPNDRTLTLLQNRNMSLSGRLFAGYALFEGKKMKFDYAKFQVEMDSVRHLDFYLPSEEIDPKTQKPVKAEAMNSTVEYVSGVVLIDAPNNKSGKEDLPTFPSLQTKKPSFVFYDRKETQKGVYKRDSFYFKLDPFPFNNLDNYRTSDLKFKGEMRPALIFPTFKESILVREEDKSFGFVHKTPPAGYPTYQQKGKYTGEVDLSNKGFLGKGTVEYLTADITSEDIVFRPRQMTCTAKKFFMEEDRASAVKVPQAKGSDVAVNWLPFRDSMYVTSKANAFELFKAPNYTHSGTLILTPSGLKGRGVFEWDGGKLTSKLISYGPFQASADTANLQIKALNGKDVVFDTKNVDGELDFDKKIGHFKANSDSASTFLPYDKYRTSMNEFTWDMAAQTITFKSDENKKGSFTSTDPDQDSLFFQGKTAFYDMKTNELRVGGVDKIKSADAYIFLSDGNLDVRPGGKMAPLKDCKIIADTANKYHTINRAAVEIGGKKFYKATGYYEYNIPGYTQEVFFNNIVGEERGGVLPGTKNLRNVRTSASGEIKEDSKFRMDVKMLFKGNMLLDASKKNMSFDGFAKLDADKLPNPQWFTVNSEVDKNDPSVKIDKAKNFDGDPLITGFYISKDFGELYPRILLPAHARVDREIINCQGFSKYETKTDRWTFGDSLRVVNPNRTKGAKMLFDNRTGEVTAEGSLNVGSGLDYMKLKVAGKLKSDFNVDTSGAYKVSGEFMTGAEIRVPQVLLDVMVGDIRANAFDAIAPVYMSQQPFYTPAVSEFVNGENAVQDAQNLLKTNQLVLPKSDNKFTFLIGRHNVQWNSEYSSFISTEDKIALVSIGGEPIIKTLTMFLEYKMPASEDDRFYFYVKPTADLWYFFGYQQGALYVASSSTKFNDTLLGLKKKDLEMKMPDGETYEIIPSNAGTAEQFVNRVKQGRK